MAATASRGLLGSLSGITGLKLVSPQVEQAALGKMNYAQLQKVIGSSITSDSTRLEASRVAATRGDLDNMVKSIGYSAEESARLYQSLHSYIQRTDPRNTSAYAASPSIIAHLAPADQDKLIKGIAQSTKKSDFQALGKSGIATSNDRTMKDILEKLLTKAQNFLIALSNKALVQALR